MAIAVRGMNKLLRSVVPSRFPAVFSRRESGELLEDLAEVFLILVAEQKGDPAQAVAGIEQTAMMQQGNWTQVQIIPADPADLGEIAAEITRYSKDNKLLSWNFMKFPDGAGQEFCASMLAYAAGKSSKDQLIDAFQKTWDNLKKK